MYSCDCFPCPSTGSLIRIETPNAFNYIYLDEYGITISENITALSFSVRANNDAHIALSKTKGETDVDSYEVVIGGWSNQKSVIRKCDQCKPKVSHNEEVLNGTEFRTFWLAWPGDFTGTNVTAGKGSVPYVNTFLQWLDPDGHQINYFGISTGWGSTGSWVFGHSE